MKRRSLLKSCALSGLVALSAIPLAAYAETQDPIKVGVLHSLSGTMAISETSLKDVALMTFDEINKEGGVLGRKIEPIVVDPASIRGKGPPTAHSGQSRDCFRLLDFRLEKVCAARI
jgi:urea transport system substrate-binding protein